MGSSVSSPRAADASAAKAHFESKLQFETDCSDVHAAFRAGEVDFVLLDVRNPGLYEESHVPGAINLPHGKIIGSKMVHWPEDTLFVVYCAGPHCNGADRAAARLAALGRPVKLMIGGHTGWADEGYGFTTGSEVGSLSAAA